MDATELCGVHVLGVLIGRGVLNLAYVIYVTVSGDYTGWLTDPLTNFKL